MQADPSPQLELEVTRKIRFGKRRKAHGLDRLPPTFKDGGVLHYALVHHKEHAS